MPPRKRTPRPAAAAAPTTDRAINLTGFSDEELAQLATERKIALPDGADRDTVLKVLTEKIAEQEADKAAAADADAATAAADGKTGEGNAGDDGAKTPQDAGDEPPARSRRRRGTLGQPIAKRDIIFNSGIIPAGEPLPEDFPAGSLPTLYEHGAIE